MNSLKRRYGFIIVPILFFICALGLMIIRCACNGYKSQNIQLERTLLSLRVDDHRGDVCIAHLYQKQAHLPLYATDRILYLNPQRRQLDAHMLAYNR